MYRLWFILLIGVSFIFPAHAQDAANCDPSDIAGTYSTMLGSASTMKDLENVSNELNRALATCRNADSEIGTVRTNPVPAGVSTQVTDAFAVTVIAHSDITDTLSGDDIDKDKVYILVGFNYQCTLSPDELCEGGLSVVSAVGQSGVVYEYVPIRAAGLEYTWELYGGGAKTLYVVFALEPVDTGDFLVRFSDRDSNRDEQVRFFSSGESR